MRLTSTDLRDLLAKLAMAGVGLSVRGGGLARTAPAGSPPGPALVAAIGLHASALRSCVEHDALRHAWQIPETDIIGDSLAVALAWLRAERDLWRANDLQTWTERTRVHLADGCPQYVASILAADDVARARLRGMAGAQAAA